MNINCNSEIIALRHVGGAFLRARGVIAASGSCPDVNCTGHSDGYVDLVKGIQTLLFSRWRQKFGTFSIYFSSTVSVVDSVTLGIACHGHSSQEPWSVGHSPRDRQPPCP